MNFISIFFGILFCIVGIAFLLGKVHPHLSAWKTMPQEEKEKIKIMPLCRNIGEVIILNGILFLMKGFWAGFTDSWFTAAMIAWLIVAGLDVWFIARSRRYQNP